MPPIDSTRPSYLTYLQRLIGERDLRGALRELVEVGPKRVPVLRDGYLREGEFWDFKAGLPGHRKEHEAAWADVAASVAAFHNRAGGLLLFGIDNKSYSFIGTRDQVDTKMFNDKIRRYVSDSLWVEFSREFIQSDQRYLGVALIPPRGIIPLRMHAAAAQRPDKQVLFSAGDFCIREGDTRAIYRGREADAYLAAHRLPAPDARYFVHDASNRILRPDWERFVERGALGDLVREGLADDRTYVTSLTGIGGVGKTALATWAVLHAYNERKLFDYIISISAKDRELTSRGIRSLDAGLTSYEELIDEILDVLGFSDFRAMAFSDREVEVRSLLKDTHTLLYVDNLETVDDPRVINFPGKPSKASQSDNNVAGGRSEARGLPGVGRSARRRRGREVSGADCGACSEELLPCRFERGAQSFRQSMFLRTACDPVAGGPGPGPGERSADR